MAEIELNDSAHCRMCADTRRKLGITPAFSQPPPRVLVGAAQLCPTHDLAGPVAAYSARVLEAIGHG